MAVSTVEKRVALKAVKRVAWMAEKRVEKRGFCLVVKMVE